MRILFTGGGTGGHVYPIISIVREARKLYLKSDLEFFYLGPEDEFGSILLSQEDIKIKKIWSGKIRRYFSFKSLFQNLLDIIFKMPFGVFQSFFLILFKLRPWLIFSKGGYGSFPVVLASLILRIPLFIHESDITPGLSNRFASRGAKKIFTSFPSTEYFKTEKVILTGNPIRSEVLGGAKEKAKELFSLTLEKPIILFLGGSQGAEKINDFILLALNKILSEFEIIHQCGSQNFKTVHSESQAIIRQDLEQYYHLYPFLNETELREAFAISDLIISRAGSGSIFEISAVGKPSILIPLPGSASEHQAKNAYFYAETGASLVIEQDNLTPNFFLEKLHYLFFHPKELEKMSQSALKFSKPLAAKAIARHILEFLEL